MKKRTLVAIIVTIAIVIVDQIIKIAVKTNFRLHETIEVFPWFRLSFVENEGMAYGMDFIGTLFLTVFRIVAIGLFIFLLVKCVKQQKPVGFIICLAMIIAGALGNVIDNCLYGLIFSESTPFEVSHFTSFDSGGGAFLEGKVVDMFYFPLFTWPESIPLVGGRVFFSAIFNFADAAITCGVIAMLLFYSRSLFSSDKNSDKSETKTEEKIETN